MSNAGLKSMSKQEKISVSFVVMTKNEERNIAKCLWSMAAFDEVFVVGPDRPEAAEGSNFLALPSRFEPQWEDILAAWTSMYASWTEQ